ncbi:SpoIIIAH-like family protein [Alkalihalophilus lindianensis]|uniref:SpoIIIAH-like family protein n=1 Tax=Alkalihalophilus lindianensis TaxID=1630542 RepID=A0ABU3XCU4_9BACI|nr:SpoIIIAH-like family protein [Alkalihalophilus lindianensis]MDV2685143.1 SpoIIIAH-like family protein [Alkalihalophilus lindianensis]
MVLKKQTVWLLTMLSLIVVLSAYYLMTPGQTTVDVAFVEDQEVSEGQQETGDSEDVVVNVVEEFETVDEAGEDIGTEVNSMSGSEFFATMRMELQENRDRMAEEYTKVRAASDVPADKVVEAHEKSMELLALSQQESMLETLIKTKGFNDVLVMSEGQEVKVIVQAEELTGAQTVEIMDMVTDQLGNGKSVVVSHE